MALDRGTLSTTLPSVDCKRFERHCREVLGLTPSTQLRRLIYAELAAAERAAAAQLEERRAS